MRKRRAWSTLDDDVDAQESAALAASLAAAKDTAAQSGALLSSAKEDLTDHQRWLRAQSAAVERDRERHERWLQRQKDLRLTSAKNDRIRRHRRLVRQRAFQAIRQAFVDLYVFVSSWIAFTAGKTAGAVRGVARSIANWTGFVSRAIASIFASAYRIIANGLSALSSALVQGVSALGRAIGHAALWTGSKLGLVAQGASAGVAAGAAWSGSKAIASMRAGREVLSASSQAVATEAGKLSREAGRAIDSGGRALGTGGRALGSGLASTGDSAASLAAVARDGVASGASTAAAWGATGVRQLSRGGAWTIARLAAIPSKVFIHVARLGREVQHFARVRAAVPRSLALPTDASAPSAETLAFSGEHSAVSDTSGVGEGSQTASVHVFETYGPHPDGTTLFGQPANEPWDPQEAPAEKPRIDGDSDNGALGAGALSEALAVSSRLSAELAAGTGRVLSSWGHGANAGAANVAQLMRKHVVTGSAWMSKQAAQAKSLTQKGMATAARAQEGALSKSTAWARKRGLDFSHMMIIAGAVLLVLGGLLVAGGFLMRSTSTSEPVVAATPSGETFSKITWRFDQPDLPLPERAVFTLSGSPEAFLINGVSIAGVNNSDEEFTILEATLSSDVQRPDLRLDVVVEPSDGAVGGTSATAVPPDAVFRLNFQFPPEATGSADGISVDDFFESYGGLLLTLRYDVDGAERSVIRYLDPQLLKTQLDEVSAQADGA